jgi:23S rRNA (cytidine1920-2'-O)/16S rRNA (cytidine1409-2'-O)-methyltransferase
MAGRRVDVEIASRGLTESREAARAAVLAGQVTVDGVVVTKAGAQVTADAVIEVAEGRRYVSRGGVKLEGALERFGIDPAGLQVLDVGASTGGFTDCLLQRGAARVTALDVGYGQLAWSLRIDPRVRVVERTNIRTADADTLGGSYDFVVIDVSFVGLAKVLPSVMPLEVEVGKGRVGKKGVVRDPGAHTEVLETAAAAVRAGGWVVRGLWFSPITGPEGNIEFWMWSAPQGEPATDEPAAVVAAAHEALGG